MFGCPPEHFFNLVVPVECKIGSNGHVHHVTLFDKSSSPESCILPMLRHLVASSEVDANQTALS